MWKVSVTMNLYTSYFKQERLFESSERLTHLCLKYLKPFFRSLIDNVYQHLATFIVGCVESRKAGRQAGISTAGCSMP